MFTLVGLLASVGPEMCFKVAFLGIGRFTMWAHKRPLASVLPHVDNQHTFVDKGGVAILADIRPLTCRHNNEISF